MSGVVVGILCPFCGCDTSTIDHADLHTGELVLRCRACGCPHEDHGP